MIGPSINWELAQAGVNGGDYSWTPDGALTFDKDCPASMIAVVKQVFAAHNPNAPDPYQTIIAARNALTVSDMVAIRCMKASVDFPPEWQKYVIILRAAVSQPVGAIVPDQPPYPPNT